MPFDASIRDLCAAFPIGYLGIPGTMTVAGMQVLKDRQGQNIWFWPQEVKFGKPGTTLFEEAREKLELLPDLTDDSTWFAALRLLAERCRLNPRQGVRWGPKAKAVFDRKRGSSGKAIAGWSLRTWTTHATFPITLTEEVPALLRALTMTNCACGRGPLRQCPIHGEANFRPWS